MTWYYSLTLMSLVFVVIQHHLQNKIAIPYEQM